MREEDVIWLVGGGSGWGGRGKEVVWGDGDHCEVCRFKGLVREAGVVGTRDEGLLYYRD